MAFGLPEQKGLCQAAEFRKHTVHPSFTFSGIFLEHHEAYAGYIHLLIITGITFCCQWETW